MRFFRSAIFPGAIAGTATPAYAHLGHMGELAGHGHLAGIAALGAAAAIAAALAARKLKQKPNRKPKRQEAEEASS
ncbi:MAG: DUF6732 family protein [Anderseniella sp.]|jgi:hypothetical protein